jgi:hypothetical protein
MEEWGGRYAPRNQTIIKFKSRSPVDSTLKLLNLQARLSDFLLKQSVFCWSISAIAHTPFG